MGKAWLRFRPSPRTARILLAALFAFPILSPLILPVFPSSAGFPHGFPHDFWPSFFLIPAAATLVEFPIAGLLASLIIFGPIFLWEGHRKSLSIAWLACWVWFCFTNLVAQYSAPLWYHPRDEWGYTFAFEQSLPVTGIMAALFFVIGLSLGRIAFEPDATGKAEPNGANRTKNEL